MASETITLTTVCAGGNHLLLTLTGAREATTVLELADLSTAVTDDEIVAFCKVIAKLAKAGRTNAQARTLLQAGVTVNV